MSYTETEVEKALSVALRRLGYDCLRPRQEEVVRTFLRGVDVFVSLPTGSGKSLCYCILPVVFDCLRMTTQSIVVIISPLVALMKDQVRAMEERNMRAVYCGDVGENESLERDICNGEYQLVFMSPEAALNDMRWRDMFSSPIYKEKLVAFVVDEAHCVKKWGDTFRKAIAEIGDVRSILPESVKLMALTATASKETRREVCRMLCMRKPALFAVSPNRSNIKYSVINTVTSLEDTFAPLVTEIKQYRTRMDRVIIYCRTYDACSMIYLYLKSSLEDESTEPIGAVDLSKFRIIDMFCACTTPKVKDSILESFRKADSVLRVVVATIAFGLGLDCPNIRTVIHWGSSGDVEQYVQETGRAGRDGLQSQAILRRILMPGVSVDKSMKDYCNNRDTCRRTMLTSYFDGSFDSDNQSSKFTNCQCCDICALTCKCVNCQ